MAERRTRSTRLYDEQHHTTPPLPPRPPRTRRPQEDADRYRGVHEAPGEAAGWSRRKAVVAIAGTTLAAAACSKAATSPKVRGLVEPAFHNALGENLPGALPAVPAAPSVVPPDPNGLTGSPGGGVAKFANRDESYAKGDERGGTGRVKPASTNSGQLSTAAAAAKQAKPVLKTPLSDSPALHLASRFTFGPTPQVIASIAKAGLDGWIATQMAPTSTTVAGALGDDFPLLAMSAKQVMDSRGENNRNAAREQLRQATLAMQMWSPWQLQEVMVDFWSNHFNVPIEGDGLGATRHVLDAKIRQLALSDFTSLLLMVGRDPAMIEYLNQNESFKGRVNENLAREHLELHSMGVGSGYTESDVRNFAYILTGRTINDDKVFEYDADRHYTGPVRVLGVTYPNASEAGGLALGDTILRRVAMHPATAAFVARKLAVRFVSDVPPPALVTRLAASFTKNKGQIKPLLRTLFTSVEFWASRGQKTLRPAENLVATARALDVKPGADTKKALDGLYYAAERMGHAPLNWPQPNGYPDVARAWESSGNMVRLWDAHRSLTTGGEKGLTYNEPEAFLGAAMPKTYGAAIDALTGRLAGQRFTQAHRAALLTFLGATETTPVASRDLKGMVQHLIPLIFDSVYKSLR